MHVFHMFAVLDPWSIKDLSENRSRDKTRRQFTPSVFARIEFLQWSSMHTISNRFLPERTEKVACLFLMGI